MSSLNKLIEKLAGSSSSVAESDVISSQTVEQNVTDPVYVEKLASAIDFINDNMDVFSEPNSSASKKDRVSIIKEAIARDPKTGRFVSDGRPTLSAPVVTEGSSESDSANNVTDITEKLRSQLKSRIAAKQESVNAEVAEIEQSKEQRKELLQNVLGKLKELKPESAEESAEDKENFYSGSTEDTASEEDIFNAGNTASGKTEETADNDSADGEVAVKAASAGQSLADVLNAALSSDGQFDESALEGTETADVHGSEGPMARKQATDNMKRRLMARIGREA